MYNIIFLKLLKLFITLSTLMFTTVCICETNVNTDSNNNHNITDNNSTDNNSTANNAITNAIGFVKGTENHLKFNAKKNLTETEYLAKFPKPDTRAEFLQSLLTTANTNLATASVDSSKIENNYEKMSELLKKYDQRTNPPDYLQQKLGRTNDIELQGIVKDNTANATNTKSTSTLFSGTSIATDKVNTSNPDVNNNTGKTISSGSINNTSSSGKLASSNITKKIQTPARAALDKLNASAEKIRQDLFEHSKDKKNLSGLYNYLQQQNSSKAIPVTASNSDGQEETSSRQSRDQNNDIDDNKDKDENSNFGFNSKNVKSSEIDLSGDYEYDTEGRDSLSKSNNNSLSDYKANELSYNHNQNDRNDKMRNKTKNISDFGDGINRNTDMSLFKIISGRYIKSAYPVFFKKVPKY